MACKKADTMNEAGYKANGELCDLEEPGVEAVRDWWERHHRTAGHKRLGRALTGRMDDTL